MNNIVLASLDEYVQQPFRMTESCVTVRFTELWSKAIIEDNISQGSV